MEETKRPESSFINPPRSHGGLIQRLWKYNILPLLNLQGPKLAAVRCQCKYLKKVLDAPPLHVEFSSSNHSSLQNLIKAMVTYNKGEDHKDKVLEIWIGEGRYNKDLLLGATEKNQKRLHVPENISIIGAGQGITTIVDVPIVIDSVLPCTSTCSTKILGKRPTLKDLTLSTTVTSFAASYVSNNGWAISVKNANYSITKVDLVGQDGQEDSVEWKRMQKKFVKGAEHEEYAILVAKQSTLHMSECNFDSIPSHGILCTKKSHLFMKKIKMHNICLKAVVAIKNSSLDMDEVIIKKSYLGVDVADASNGNIKRVEVSNCTGLRGQNIGIQATNSTLILVDCKSYRNNTGLFLNNSIASIYDFHASYNNKSAIYAMLGSTVDVYGSQTKIHNNCGYLHRGIVLPGDKNYPRLQQYYQEDGISSSQIRQTFAVDADNKDSSITFHVPLIKVCDRFTLRSNIFRNNTNDIGGKATVTIAGQKYNCNLFRPLNTKLYFPRKPCISFLDLQTDITSHMRHILVDWLTDVADEYNLRSTTLFLAVNYVDRFLSKYDICRHKLQLLGCACLLLASKFEEIYPPAVDEFVYISDNTYTHEEIVRMEILMCATLKFNKSIKLMKVATTATYLEHFLAHITFTSNANKKDEQNTNTKHLANFFIELSLQNYEMLKFQPSMVAASAISLARRTCQLSPIWHPSLENLTQYKHVQLAPCEHGLLSLHKRAKKRFEKKSHEKILTAVYEKYSRSRFKSILKLPLAKF